MIITLYTKRHTQDFWPWLTNSPSIKSIPDNAKVWRPPAATLAILMPGFSVTRHGNAVRFSSLEEEVSAVCFDEETLLLFVLSSPLVLEAVPAVDFEP